jgi:hypothetical protein
MQTQLPFQEDWSSTIKFINLVEKGSQWWKQETYQQCARRQPIDPIYQEEPGKLVTFV